MSRGVTGRLQGASGRVGRPPRAILIGLLLMVWVVGSACPWPKDEPPQSTTSGAVWASTTTTTDVVETSTTTTERPAASTTTTRRRPPSPIPAGGLEFVRVPGDARVVALTFDAAYDPAPLDDILGVLDAEGVPATFFLTGEFVEDFPDEVAAIVAAGHPIGSHSYSHPDFTKLSDDEARDQLQKTAALLRATRAGDPRPLFRFPYGARDRATLALVGEEGYVSVYWTIDTLDWKAERTTAQIRDTVLSKVAPGAIVLMHVGGKNTVAALSEIIPGLRAAGFGFVELGSAIGAATAGPTATEDSG